MASSNFSSASPLQMSDRVMCGQFAERTSQTRMAVTLTALRRKDAIARRTDGKRNKKGTDVDGGEKPLPTYPAMKDRKAESSIAAVQVIDTIGWADLESSFCMDERQILFGGSIDHTRPVLEGKAN